ncbi:MAG: pre-peptidase C-terminal domain-containing protein [Planctomycetaceae bacterium]|nr:pre-peptidase C-terminal domain-containing protein [Planctomycetaceae bacterium]
MPRTDKVCFDRILPSDLARPISGRMFAISSGPARAAFQIAKLWPNGTTIHVRFLGGTSSQQRQVKQFSIEWTEHANLRFEFSNSPSAQVRIAFEDDGAWSYVGTDSLGIPSNQPTMNFGWVDQGVVLHEFGHMLGMIHEHQNPASNPIQWNKPVVNAALGGPPNNWDQATIDHNMYAKYDVSQLNGSNFDRDSVMLYSFPANWTLNGFQSDPNETLSPVDKEFARRVYPGRDTGSTATTTELTVYEGATQAAIGTAGEEDLYSFTVKSPGRYVIETEGPTDLVMSLYGPTGNLIAQDDDSGIDRNPRIGANLSEGKYTVQVRHYNESNGTGNYGIKVSKA